MLAVVADVHVTNHNAFGGVSIGRRNDRCRAVEAALASAVALSGEAAAFIVAGDLFDNDRPFPDHIRAVGDVLRKGPDKVLIVGNHDQHSNLDNDHALAPLGLLDNTAVADTPQVYTKGGVTFDALPFHVDVLNYSPTGTVVIAHHGIADDKTPVFLRHGKGVLQTKDLFAWMALHGVKVYIAGDWHEHKHWTKGDCHIIQCGALVPTGWNNPGHYGYGSVILTDGVTWRRELVPGPRFLFAGSAEELVKEVTKAKKRGDIPYVRAACPAFEDPALEGAFIEWAPALSRAEGNVKVAAEHLKSATTLQECIDAYIQADMSIPADMRGDVARKLTELMVGT